MTLIYNSKQVIVCAACLHVAFLTGLSKACVPQTFAHWYQEWNQGVNSVGENQYPGYLHELYRKTEVVLQYKGSSQDFSSLKNDFGSDNNQRQPVLDLSPHHVKIWFNMWGGKEKVVWQNRCSQNNWRKGDLRFPGRCKFLCISLSSFIASLMRNGFTPFLVERRLKNFRKAHVRTATVRHNNDCKQEVVDSHVKWWCNVSLHLLTWKQILMVRFLKHRFRNNVSPLLKAQIADSRISPKEIGGSKRSGGNTSAKTEPTDFERSRTLVDPVNGLTSSKILN